MAGRPADITGEQYGKLVAVRSTGVTRGSHG